jgi:hypothetical protein
VAGKVEASVVPLSTVTFDPVFANNNARFVVKPVPLKVTGDAETALLIERLATFDALLKTKELPLPFNTKLNLEKVFVLFNCMQALAPVVLLLERFKSEVTLPV